MWKQRVKTWNLRKNYTAKDRELILRILQTAGSGQSVQHLPTFNGDPIDLKRLSRHGGRSQLQGRRRRASSSVSSDKNKPVLEEADPDPPSDPGCPAVDDGPSNSPPPLVLSRMLPAPPHLRHLEEILFYIDQYYRACFRGQHRLFSNQFLGGMGMVDVDNGFADMGLWKIHDPGYAAISMVKSGQYRAARILLGETQDGLKDLLRAQHPTLLPFVLEIICEDSTTPEFNVSELFRQYVYQLSCIIKGEQHPLTMILQLLGVVDYKLRTCAAILNKIQAILSAEFGATKWEARRPVKVFCRVLRHLGCYDEVEQILPTAGGDADNLETPAQSELLGLLYERAWLIARGRHDNQAATKLFKDIVRLTDEDAKRGQISHFRIKALRGLGVLAREESRHDISQQYFSAAWRGSRWGFGRRYSNTVRIGSELEESLRTLGRIDEADQLRKERDALFLGDEEAIVEKELEQSLLAIGSGGREVAEIEEY